MQDQNARLWSPFSQMPSDRVNSVTIVRGDGQFVFDYEDRRYLDGLAGLWYTHIGHGRRQMAEAVKEQLQTLAAFQTHGYYDNLPALQLAERLTTLFPIDDPLVFFGAGGGDAIETACKLAREYWRAAGVNSKSIIITRQHGYHGMHGFGSSIVGIPALHVGSEDGFPNAVVPENDLVALEARIAEIGPDRIAGFIAEPVIGAGGVIPPAEGYLHGAQDLCRENDILLISDEVVTGFGRLGMWSGAEYYGLEPDMAVIAKGLTSGYIPLGGVIVSRRIWEVFESTGTMFRHGYTYSGHPAACVAALTNIDILTDEDLLARAGELSLAFSDILGSLEEMPVVSEVRRVGLMAGIGWDKEYLRRRNSGDSVQFGTDVNDRCRESGVILRRMFQGDIQVSPPLIIEQEDIVRIRDVVEASIKTVLSD